MDDKSGISKESKLVICLIIMFVFVTGMYVVKTNKSIDTSTNEISTLANDSIVQAVNDVVNEQVNNEKENQESAGEELDFESEEVQDLFLFTGAFPTGNLAYITKLRNIDTIDNDFILKAAFSKVTKNDWAGSYVAEGNTLVIGADLLEEYIHDVFGDIEYTNEDFNNEDVKFDNSNAGIYNIKYDEVENKYYIDINTGDADESVIEFLYPKAVKYSDRIEISIHPIYIRNCGEAQDQDGNTSFSYIAYKHYNYETNAFVSRITDTMNGIYQVNEETGEIEYNKLIQGIQEKDLETYTFIYKFNEETEKYEFETFNSK